MKIFNFIKDDDFKDDDLFLEPELLPIEVQKAINAFKHGGDAYKECAKLEKRLKKLGYVMEYGLDGIPYDLHKI